MLITLSCDEEVEEVAEDEAQEFVAKPGTTKVFDHWSSGKCTYDLQKASQLKELRVFLQEASLSRISPIL